MTAFTSAVDATEPRGRMRVYGAEIRRASSEITPIGNQREKLVPWTGWDGFFRLWVFGQNQASVGLIIGLPHA